MKPITELTDRIFKAEQEQTSITISARYKEKFCIEHEFKDFTYDLEYDEDAEETISITLYFDGSEITITDTDNIDCYKKENDFFQLWNDDIVIFFSF